MRDNIRLVGNAYAHKVLPTTLKIFTFANAFSNKKEQNNKELHQKASAKYKNIKCTQKKRQVIERQTKRGSSETKAFECKAFCTFAEQSGN